MQVDQQAVYHDGHWACRAGIAKRADQGYVELEYRLSGWGPGLFTMTLSVLEAVELKMVLDGIIREATETPQALALDEPRP